MRGSRSEHSDASTRSGNGLLWRLVVLLAVVALARSGPGGHGAPPQTGADGAWLLLTELGRSGLWSAGHLWGGAIAVVRAAAPHLSARSAAVALSGALAPLAAGLVGLLCLEAVLASRRTRRAEDPEPGLAAVACGIACGVALAWTPQVRAAAASPGPWSLTLALSALFLWRAQRCLNRGRVERADALLLGLTAGLALANDLWSVPALLAGALPALYGALQRPRFDEPDRPRERGRGPAPLLAAGLVTGLAPGFLARWWAGPTPEDGAWGAALALTRVVPWNTGVTAAPLAVRHMGASLVTGLGAGLILACLAAGALAILIRLRDPNSEATSCRMGAIWPAVCAVLCGWAPAWGAAGPEAAQTLFPCCVGVTVLAAIGCVWAAELPRIRLLGAVVLAGGLAAVVVAASDAVEATDQLARRRAQVEPRDLERWAERLVARLDGEEDAVVALDSELAPLERLADALLRARVERRSPARWRLAVTTEGESVERPTLTTSWREAVAEGRPLYADDGLLTDRSAAVAPAAEPAADGWTRRAEAAALLSRGRAEEALSLLRDGAALSTAEAHLRIAALRAAGEAERAREALVTATHREPTNPALWWERGDLLEESGDERGAAQARKIAASLDRRAAHAGIY